MGFAREGARAAETGAGEFTPGRGLRDCVAGDEEGEGEVFFFVVVV